MHEALPGLKQRNTRLLLLGLGRDEPHLWLPCRNDDCLRIGCVVFLPLDERADLLRRDQQNLVAKLHQFTRPIMSVATDFYRDHKIRMLGRELQELAGR